MLALFIGNPIPIGSPIIVTIRNIVFANKSWKLGWIWMKLGRRGWGLKRLSLARIQWSRAMGFGESAKKWDAEALFLLHEPRTTSATFLWSISAKFFTNPCAGGGWWHMVSHSRKVSVKRLNFPKNRLFPGTSGYPVCAQPMGQGNVLRCLHSFHPLVDIPQIYLSWVTFAEGCTVFHLSTSESDPLPQYQQWAYLDGDTVAPSGERRDTTQ